MQSTPEKYPNNSKFAGLLFIRTKKNQILTIASTVTSKLVMIGDFHIWGLAGVGGTFK